MQTGFPPNFPKPEMYGGVGKGWWLIIQELHQDLLKLDPYYTISQVKEKFGGLRYYYSPSRKGNGSYALSADAQQKMEELVAEAEKRCWKTCEVCGEEGEPGVTKGGYWIKTLCPVHKEEARKEHT